MEFVVFGGFLGLFLFFGLIFLLLIWRICWVNLNLYFSFLKYVCFLVLYKCKVFFIIGCEYRLCVLRVSWKVRGEEIGSFSIVNLCGLRM